MPRDRCDATYVALVPKFSDCLIDLICWRSKGHHGHGVCRLDWGGISPKPRDRFGMQAYNGVSEHFDDPCCLKLDSRDALRLGMNNVTYDVSVGVITRSLRASITPVSLTGTGRVGLR